MALFGSLQFHSIFTRTARTGSVAFLLFLLFTSVARAQGPTWNWAATLDAGNTEFVRDIAVDPGTGNFYAVGAYRSSAATAASYALPASVGGSQDAFLAKLDPSGNVLWSRAFGSTQEDAALGVSVASNGVVVITGYYGAPIAGMGLTNSGSQDAFIVAYDATGAFQWARSVTGPQREEGTSIVISGNTVVAYGSFTYNDSNTSGVLATSGLNNNRGYAYLNAYDLTGAVLWSITGVSDDDILSERIATDGTNVYVVGSTKGDALRWRNSLGNSSTTVTTADDDALFCSAIRLSGIPVWSRLINNPGDSDVECNGVAVDCGNVYITGKTHNNSAFPIEPSGTIRPTAPGSHDYWFLAALSTSNGSTNWVRTASSSIDHGVTGYDVCVGRNGQIHVAGTLTGTMTTDGGTVIGGGSAYDLLISRFNSDGTAVWYRRETSNDAEFGFAIAPLGGGRILVGGEYENGLTLGSSAYPGSNGTNLFTANFTDPDWVYVSNNPARFALPGPFCSSAATIDLNSYLQAYAVTITGSSNVASPVEATDAPNGVGSHFNTTSGWVVLDMKDTVLVGEAVQLVWRSQTNGVQARMLVSSSLDGVNWSAASTLNTTSATYGTATYPVPSNARFIRVQRHSSSTYTSFHLDAVRYYGSTLTGGTWSGGSHVTAAGIFTATAAGSFPVTYTVVQGACTYSYTRSIEVNPAPNGTITGPATLCPGATGTWSLSAPVGTTIAWQRSTNGGALWSTFANNVASVSGVLGQATMFRALLSNASCTTPVATNTIETVPGDTQGPTFPPLADIVRRTATGRCDTVVSFATPVVTDNCTTCDPGTLTGYTRLGVFEGHAYYMSNATSLWPQANTAANATGGHMVYITSAAENTWLAAQTSTIEVFIGMSDEATEGTWLWGDGQPVVDAPWAPGHPITWSGYDFGALNVGGNGRWGAVGGILPSPRRHIVEFDCAVWQSAGPSSGSAFPIGSTTVTFSASDLGGNISSRSFEVTVEDVVPPTFTQCPGNLILAMGAGCAARVPNLVALASATDDCSTVVMGQVPEPNDIITTDSLAYIVAKDVYGNTDTCWVQLSVQDQTAPVILSCPTDITINVPLAQLDIQVTYIPPTASDYCGVVWNAQTDGTGLTSGSAFPIGTTPQQWSFRDAAGNMSVCSFEVTVVANDAPQLLCPMFSPVATDAGQCSAIVNHSPPVAFDAQDGSLTATLMPPSLPPGPFPIGTSTVTYRVQDLDGNVASCSFTVTVIDGEAPSITCPPSQTLNSATTECSTFVSWLPPTVADNCPSCLPTAALSSYVLLGSHDGKQYYLENDPVTFDGAVAAAQSMGYHLLSIGTPEENDFVLASLNAVGVDPVWIGLTDEVTEGTFLWHSGEPLLYQNWVGGEPNNIGEEDAVMMTGAGQWNDVPVGITLPYIIEVPCSGLELYQTGGPTNGSAFPVGTTDVSYTVIDAAGRSADCVFTITVVDSIPPIFSNCPSDESLTLPGNDCTLAYSLPSVFSDDGNACDTDTETGYRTEVLLSGALTPLDITGWANLALPHGTHRFRETHTDDAGNQAMCEWKVTVQDVMHPEVVCLLTDSFPLYLDGACSIAFPDLRSYVTATDCNGATIDMWPLPGTVFTGDTLVQMTMVVKDSLGNSVPNNHSIWIHDNTPPSITCPDTLFFPATTSCLGNVLLPGPTSVLDNCGVPSWTVDANNGLWPVGDSTITYTVTDGRNSATCATVIRVLDGTPATPTITASGPTTFCSGGSVTLTSSSATGNLWSNGATTNSITVNTAGSYAVSVTDANGCSSASASISVVVNTPPVTPVITASGPTTFCSGGSVTLTSSSATGNLWSNGATTNSITVNTAGTYAVTVTDANSCSSASASISVIVNTPPVTPVITASGPTTFCSGGSVTLTSSSATGNLWSNGATTNSITVNTAGSYAVSVTDANGCSSASASISVVVNTPPVTPVITASGPTTFCSGGSVTLTSSSATGNLWSNGATTNSITVNTAGTYAVTVTDANSCSSASASISVIVNTPPVTPVITASGPTTFCSGGSVTLTSSSATGNLWSNGATTNSITVNTAGSYTVTVTDANGCSSASASSSVIVNTPPVTPVITASGPTTFCSGGSVTLTSSSATGNLWSNGATTNSITVNTAGSYAVTVTDANGCSSASASISVVVNTPPVTPVITASGPTTFCSGGSVTLTSSSATGNLWSNGATTNSITVNTAGTYAVTVTDANGCSSASASSSVIVNTPPVTPVITASGPTTFCSGGSVTLTSSSATGNLWSNGATTNSITVNTSGTYAVTVIDANGCSSTSASISVVVNTPPATPVITASGPTTFCSGGSVTLTSSSATGNLWSNGATTNSITVNTAGSYTVTVTDANGCSSASASSSVIVNTPPVTPVITASGPTTFCSGGSVTLTSSSATGNLWSNGATTNSITVNTAGSYAVTVTDANSCSSASASISVIVNTPPVTPVITASGPTTFCSGGSVTLTSSSATGNLWSNGATTNSITVNTAGSYAVTVTDANGCSSASASSSVIVNTPPVTPVITASGPTTFCSGGSVTLTSSSATGNLWSNGATTNSITVNTAGTYAVTVTDANSCSSASASISVIVNTPPVTPVITASGPTTFCSGGSVTLTSSSATGNLWSNGATTNSITVNTAGSYTVTVTDANGCSSASASISVVVNTPPVTPVITASGPTTFCSGGSVTLTSSSATGNLWSNGATTNSITVNTAGSYTVTVTDANGCSSASASSSVIVNTPPVTPVITASGPTTFCSGGSVTLTSSSATGNLWSNGATTNSITVNTSGTYAVTVIDANGCSSTSASISVVVNTPPATPVITASGPTTFCSGGSVTLTSSSATGNLWSNGATTNSITVNTAGSYTVTVTDANGCSSASASSSVIVNTPPVTPVITASGPTTFCSGGSVTLTSSSATGNLWSNGATTNSITVNTAGSYAVTVTDANSCSSASASISVIVNTPPVTPVITASGPTTFCSGGSVTLTSSSATGNLWSNGATTNSITVNTAGSYAVTVTDANGCSSASASISVVVNTPPVTPVITASGPTTFCSGGSVTLTSSSATGNLWSNGATTNSITVNTAGSYTVTVTEANGCSATSSAVPVQVDTPPQPVIAPIPVLCSTGGPIELVGTPSTGTWSGPGVIGASFNPGTAGPGNHTITYTVGQPGCINTATINIQVDEQFIAPPFSYAGSPFCTSGSVVPPPVFTAVPNPGGSFSNTGLADFVTATGQFNAGGTSPGTYAVTYTSAANGVCPSLSIITMVQVNTSVWAGNDATLELCGTASPVPLFGSLTGANAGGTWTSPLGVVHTGVYDPAVDGSGTYRYTVVGPVGCGSDTAVVDVSETPAPNGGTLVGDADHCGTSNSGTLLLSGHTGNQQWQKRINGGPWTDFANATNSYTYSNLPVGIYDYRVVLDAPGCPQAMSNSVTVRVSRPPNAGTANPIFICQGTSFTLDVLVTSEDVNGTWTDVNGAVVSGTIAPIATTAYTYTVPSDGSCVSDARTVQVTVIQPPNAGSNGSISVCSTDPALNLFDALNGTPSTGGTWTGPSPITGGLYDAMSMVPGTYTYTVNGQIPCPSAQSAVVVSEVTATSNTTSISACDTYTWSVNGATYTQSGTYTHVDGCHTDTLVLTITPSTSNTTTISACDTYTWSVNGATYTQSGTYTDVDGCRTETLVLTIVSSTNNTTTVSACDTYTWNISGLTYTESGTYTSVSGCGTQTLVLNITPSTNNTSTISACDTYTWSVNGATYTQSGTYTDVVGCHTETLVLNITPSTNNTTTISACDTYTWSVNGATYTQSGTYTDVVGCHTETLVLNITPSTNNTTTISACDTYTWSVNGATYTQSGTYTDVDGCHTETLVLTITPSTSNTTTISACDTYTWSVNGATYTQSGTYTDVDGCRTETLVLTIVSSTNNTTTVSACDTYTWNISGLTYTESGTYTSVSGCGTQTLVLNITPSTNNTSTISACDTYTWSVNGATYTQSGTYTDVVGCHTETLVLNITPSTNNTTTISACDTYTWSVNGATYTQSGTYTDVVGCHTETLVLNITPSTNNTTTISACDTYTWSVNGATYTQSGTYTDVDGCHTETLVLTITPSTNNTTTISACDTYTWSVNGVTYTQSGTYTDVDGCHTESLVLTITPSTSNTTTISACDTYTWSVNGATYTQSGTYTDVDDCHTETLVLTIVSSTNNTTTVSACDTYTWNISGLTYTESGTYTSVSGCGTQTLVLTIAPSTNNTTTISACDTYTWSVNGATYTQSGTYTDVVGCHTETLVLNITPSTNNTTTISGCDTYTWSVNGATYTQSGTYTDVDDCHTETLILTITPSTNNTTTISACDTYTWSVNGATYNQSGTYTDVDGCHTETLVLTIVSSTNNTTTVSACDTYTWNISGLTYTESGTYTSVSGCGTQTLVLTITPSTSNTTTISACDTYTWSVNGTTYTQSGTYTDVDDCHTETLILTITPSTNNTTTISACDTYTWSVNGATYNQSGTYTDVDGCHTETLVLTIVSSTNNTTTVSACDTYTWNISGLTYTESGTYTSVSGCGTQTLVLTITPSTNNTATISACDTYTWSVNGATYTESGTYTDVDGCATETLVLTITPSTNNTTTISECDTYTWSVNGSTYTQSGTYTDVDGCHTETLVLTIVSSTNNTTTVSACDTYTWNISGLTYTESGTYTSVSGCGIQTLVLTITPSTNNTATISACDTYTWSVNGATYTESGTYTDVDGCATETLVLTITPSTNNTTTISACDTYTWSVNGATYTESGTYTDVDGCATEILVLTITPSTNNTTTISACDSYTWNVSEETYTQSGTYVHSIGCVNDTLNLTIITTPSAAFNFGASTICTNEPTALPEVPTPGGLFSSSEGLAVDPMSGAINPASSVPGSYTITYTLDGQCPSSATVNVTIVAAPNADWNSPVSTCDNSGTLQLAELAENAGGVWSGSGVTGATFDPGGLVGPVTITYTVESSGCTASVSHDIAVIGAPQAVAGPDTIICGYELLLSGAATSGTGIWSGPVEVLFTDPNAPTSTVLATGAGSYSLVWTVSENGCSSSDTAIVTMRPPADQLNVFAGEDQILEVETTTTLEAITDAGAQVEWTLVGGSAQFDAPNSAATIVSGLSLGTNTVMVTVSLGSCTGTSDTLTITVEDLFIPQGFSPNGDGDNDRFEVTGMMAYPNSSFTVFNRWGQKVYDNSAYSNEWDGRSAAGTELPDDTYFYVLNLEGDRTYNGFVVIKR